MAVLTERVEVKPSLADVTCSMDALAHWSGPRDCSVGPEATPSKLVLLVCLYVTSAPQPCLHAQGSLLHAGLSASWQKHLDHQPPGNSWKQESDANVAEL
eukprot:CAMPEP_0115150682 /NCGR_PEP_ID=MMETSP0227-20121206/65179_1 /TAXON_ID=89957 /ORGANISM="Polarella glacialis, Strain CCMP 1383" /LENGTH=99 /DNA_ID=CAMNT_0002561083 /DNA_START=546 /DNA_END=845 /DNA_ORIENTATION=-